CAGAGHVASRGPAALGGEQRRRAVARCPARRRGGYRAPRLFDQWRLTVILRSRVRPVGRGAATSRASRETASLARGGVGLDGADHAAFRARAAPWGTRGLGGVLE